MTELNFQRQTGRPRISISATRAAYIGPSLNLAPHRNVVATLAFGLDGPFWLKVSGLSGEPALTRETRFALIPPGRLHHLKATGWVGFVYLDPCGDDHRAILQNGLDDLDAPLATIGAIDFMHWSVDEICALIGLPQRPPADARIAATLRSIDLDPSAFSGISTAARVAQLSVSRFQSLLRETTGVPFRRYRLWRRMVLVMRSLSEGQSLTNAALDGGFSSSAHLSSTFRAMFGIAPSTLAGVQIEFAP